MARIDQTFVIGLDGGTFDVIDYLLPQGRLPGFARLLEGGSRATLMSSVPPITPAAWASFYTGMNPGKSGVVDFFKWQQGTYKLAPVNAHVVGGKPVWSSAGEFGRRVCVYNVPVTYPAMQVNGILISGMDAPHVDEKAVYPRDFREQLLSQIPAFAIDPGIDFRYLVNNSADPLGDCIRLLTEHLEMEIETVRYLADLEEWDLFVSVFRSPDAFQHLFWSSIEKVISGSRCTKDDRRRAEATFTCYERLDREITLLLDRQPPVNLLIMSDHGFGALEREVCLNRVLEKAGLLKFLPRKSSGLKQYARDEIKKRVPKHMRRRLKQALGRGGTEERWDMFVDSLIADIDWAGTEMCAVGQFGCLFVNMKQHKPLGIVEESGRNEVLARAEAAFRKLVDPQDGRPVVSHIYRRDDLYSGPSMAEMPDLVLVMRDYAYRGIYSTAFELSGDELIRLPRSAERKQLAHTGTHRREGILMLHGPGINHGDIGKAEMVDVAPTLMNLMGLPASGELDGRILVEALRGGVRKTGAHTPGPGGDSGPVDHEPAYTEEDEDEVRKRLSDLGYI